MQKKRHLCLWLCITIPMLAATACGVKERNGTAVSEAKQTETNRVQIEMTQPSAPLQVETPKPAVSGEEKKIVRIFLPDRKTERFRMDGEYLEEQFENAGFDAVVYDAGADAEKQAAALKGMTELPTDLCVLVPLNTREVREAVREIDQSEIPLIIYDQPFFDMKAAAFFVGFQDSDVKAALEDVQLIEEAHQLELEQALAEAQEVENAEAAPEEESADDAQEVKDSEETTEETAKESISPLLGEDSKKDSELLRELADGEKQALVYRDTAGEAVVVLDIGINLLRGVTPDAGLIAASGWGFPCTYQAGTPGEQPDAFYLQPVLITTENMEEKLVIPGYYKTGIDGYLQPVQTEEQEGT